MSRLPELTAKIDAFFHRVEARHAAVLATLLNPQSLAGGLALFLLLALMQSGGLVRPANGGNFYAVFPHNLLVSLFAPVFLFAALALALGVRRFWRDITPATSGAALSPPAASEATHDVLRLKYLDGGHGEGCNNEDDAFTLWRKRFHHFTFYGFMLCFASTSVATIYHYFFDWHAPYEIGRAHV